MRNSFACWVSIPFLLTACASTQPVFHTQAQLNDVGRQCGLAFGELIQDEEAEELLFFIREEPTLPERMCVFEFAEANNLKVVKLDGITFADEE